MEIPHQYASNKILSAAYARGWNHGHGIACHNVPEMGKYMRVDSLGRALITPENIREYHEAFCFEAESNSRDFSPFEFIAHEFNSLGDDEDCEISSDEVWEAFEAGVGDSIRHDLSSYTDEDYGILKNENDGE
jgi:hypothetical protein